MKTLNLTKLTPANLGKFIDYRNISNEELPEEIENKFIKDNYIIGKGSFYLMKKENNTYIGDITNHYISIEYKKEKNVLCIIHKNKGKQNFYIVNVHNQ